MKHSLLALSLLAVLPFAASAAEGVSYNHVQGGYAATNTDGADADGWGLDGSVAVHSNFHVFGGYNRQKIDHTSIDIDQWRAGVGYHHELSSKTDLLTRVAYEKYDAGQGLSTHGYSVEAGARAALLPKLEGYALAGYESQDRETVLRPDDSNFYGRLGAQLKFNQNWAVSGDVKVAKGGDTQWFVGPRMNW